MQACALAIIVLSHWHRAVAGVNLVQKTIYSLSKPHSTTPDDYEPQANGDASVCTRSCTPNCCQACPSVIGSTLKGPNMSVSVTFEACKAEGTLSWVVAKTKGGSLVGFIEKFNPQEVQTFNIPASDYIHLQLRDESFMVNGDSAMCEGKRGAYGQSNYWADACSGGCGGQSSACEVIMYLEAPTTTTTTTVTETTTTTTSCETTSCEIYNDPHIIGFDSEDEGPASLRHLPVLMLTDLRRPSYSGVGDVWLVKTDLVHIQGRYVSSQVFKTAGAVMGAIAIGGPILDGQVLLVEPHNGTVTFGRHEVPVGASEHDVAHGRIQFQNSDLVFKKRRPFTRLEVHLPMHVDLTINRYNEYINAKITMPKVGMGRVDGQCGDWHGRIEDDDDKGAAIKRRMDESGIPPGESLFEGHTRH